MKPADPRQSGSSLSTPELSSSSSIPPTAHPLAVPILPSQWPGLSEQPQWTSGIVSAGQQAAAAAPAVSLSPGSVLPINLLPAELSSLLGMAPSSTSALSSSASIGLLLPGGLLVSADGSGQNVVHHDPLASLSRLSSGIQNVVVPATTTTSINNSMLTAAQGRRNPGNVNGPHVVNVPPPETVRSYGSDRHSGFVGNRLAVSVSKPAVNKLPDVLGGAYTTVKSEHAAAVGPQMPLVSELPPQTTTSSSSMYSSALHQLLLQQGTTSRNVPSAPPPPYTKVSESSMLPTGGTSSPPTAESTAMVAPLSSGRRRWTSADSAVLSRYGGGTRGYPECLDDVANMVNLFRQESSGFDIGRNSSAPADGGLPDPMQAADADRDAGEFSAPSAPGLHHKFRRKNRPQPLIIPSPVGQFGFQSRLRSPRVSTDQSGPGLPTEASSSVAAASAATLSLSVAASVAGLTPYTPPPMLSPVRTGSGLFYSLIQPSPKSAPVGFRLGLLRCSKFFVVLLLMKGVERCFSSLWETHLGATWCHLPLGTGECAPL